MIKKFNIFIKESKNWKDQFISDTLEELGLDENDVITSNSLGLYNTNIGDVKVVKRIPLINVVKFEYIITAVEMLSKAFELNITNEQMQKYHQSKNPFRSLLSDTNEIIINYSGAITIFDILDFKKIEYVANGNFIDLKFNYSKFLEMYSPINHTYEESLIWDDISVSKAIKTFFIKNYKKFLKLLETDDINFVNFQDTEQYEELENILTEALFELYYDNLHIEIERVLKADFKGFKAITKTDVDANFIISIDKNVDYFEYLNLNMENIHIKMNSDECKKIISKVFTEYDFK